MTKQLLTALLIAGLSATASVKVLASSEPTFIPVEVPFELIESESRMAEAWATCAAVYDIYAELVFEPGSARSQMMENLANGAEVAAGVSYVRQLILNAEEIGAETVLRRFNNVWSMAKLQMTELPKVQLATVLAAAESSNYSEEWLTKLQATFQQCQDNNEAQQGMIDLYRALVTNGFLELPAD